MSKKVIKKGGIIIIFSLVLFFVFLSASFLFAQERKLEIDYPEIFGLKPETVATGLPEYAKYIFNLAVMIVGLILFGVLIWGGILYLTSAGNVTKLKEAKDRILAAFLGTILLLSSVLVLQIIHPELLEFKVPVFPPFLEKEVAELTPLEPEKTSIIALELPVLREVESGLFTEERRKKTEELIFENENFLMQEIKLGSPTFERISDLNKYLKNLVEECRCENTKALSTFPTNFGMPVDPKACVGDPCPEKTRKEIEKIVEINRAKQKELLEFQKKNIEMRNEWEKQLSVFVDIEEQIHNCDQQDRRLITLNEYLARHAQFDKENWKTETVTVPGAVPAGGDPSTFYCDKGGTLFRYPYPFEEEEEIEEFLSPELTELVRPELIERKIAYQRISCPIEFPVGEITDKARSLAGSLIVGLDELADLQGKMAFQLERMGELISQCNEKNCTNNTLCVPNPCFQKCAPRLNPCLPFCKSPCLQAAGGCFGFCPTDILLEIGKKIEDCLNKKCLVGELEKLYQEVEKCRDACPRPEIALTVGEIKVIEDEIFRAIKETKEIFPEAASLIFDRENPKHISNIRTGMNLCYSKDPQEPNWGLLSCRQAIGNYGPTNQILASCHPRNFFCCILEPDKKLVFDWRPPALTPAEEMGYILPEPKYKIPEYTEGCPPGWRCNPAVSKYNQYQDASEPLKELLACMRQRLDNIQKEQGIPGPSIGRITSISDSKLYTGQCYWETGPSSPPCSHLYNIGYDNIRVSCHYGGYWKRYERKSYAADFGAILPGDHYRLVIQAAKECRPGVFTLVHKSQETDQVSHVHISLDGDKAGCK